MCIRIYIFICKKQINKPKKKTNKQEYKKTKEKTNKQTNKQTNKNTKKQKKLSKPKKTNSIASLFSRGIQIMCE